MAKDVYKVVIGPCAFYSSCDAVLKRLHKDVKEQEQGGLNKRCVKVKKHKVSKQTFLHLCKS